MHELGIFSRVAAVKPLLIDKQREIGWTGAYKEKIGTSESGKALSGVMNLASNFLKMMVWQRAGERHNIEILYSALTKVSDHYEILQIKR